MPLDVGDKAPKFSLPADNGETLSSKDFSGKILVLYFYPKDDTSGCTSEALQFTEAAADFAAAGAVVLGVSKDSAKKHDKFIAKHGLNVRLLADEECTLCQAYGVWIEKSMYGRKYMGIDRSTFVIDSKGKIRHAWRKVKVPGHAAAVLDAVKEL